MSVADNLRNIFAVGMPVIERELDVKEDLTEIRKSATEKGINWAIAKSIMKAHAEDKRDQNGKSDRLSKLVEKADLANAYLDMLGLSPDCGDKKNIAPQSENHRPLVTDDRPRDLSPLVTQSSDGLDPPAFLLRAAPAAS